MNTFTLTDYFDIWLEDTYIVNNAIIAKRDVKENEIDTRRKVIRLLKQEGIIGHNARIDKRLKIDWTSDTHCEIYQNRRYGQYPIASLSQNFNESEGV